MRRSLNNKGEISFQVLVMGILALLVLAVIAVIFTSGSRDQKRNLNDCAARGGTCVSESQCSQNGISKASFVTCYNDDGTENTGLACCLGYDA